MHDPGEGDPPPGSQPHCSTDRLSLVSRDQLLQRMRLPLSLGGLGLRAVVSTRHAAYFASLMQMLPHFVRLHPELRVKSGFQQTRLYAELTRCRQELHEAGAASEFDMRDGCADRGTEQHQPNASDALQALFAASSAAAAAATAATFHLTTDVPSHITTSPTRPAPTASFLSTRFPSPTLALTQSIDDSWLQVAAAAASSSRSHAIPSAAHLQGALTRSIEATKWLQLFNGASRYQQTILTSLALNPSTSSWLSCPPLSSEPAYRMRDEEYVLAVRHRLGMLPYDDLRDELCVSCAHRNLDTPSLLADPDHMHSCTMQEGVSVKRRHDAIKLALAQLARECGYHVEVEPRFPARFIAARHPMSGSGSSSSSSTSHQEQKRGDLLLLRNGTRQLIDVTVVSRPT